MKLAIIALLALVAGRATTDPARHIERNCPTKRVYGDELDEAVRDLDKWQLGDKVRVGGDGYCTHNAKAVKRWAEAKGMPCEIVDEYHGTHWAVHPVGSKYTISWVDYVGLVRRKCKAKNTK